MTDIQKIMDVVAKIRANPKLARDVGIVAVLAVIGAAVCAALGVDFAGLAALVQDFTAP